VNRFLDIGLVLLLAVGFGMIVAHMVDEQRRYTAARRSVYAHRLERVGLLLGINDAMLDNADRIERWKAKRNGEWPSA
jgi:hypothetical protein